MTIQEFRQWFEGYTLGVMNRPTFDQWRVIREKIASISLEGPENDVFADRNGITKRHTNVQPLKVEHD